MPETQVIISGSIAIDRIMNFEGRYRELIDGNKLDVVSVSVLVDTFDQARGGTGANIAYNLALLGEKPILFGSVGSDAAEYMSALSSKGVNTENVHTSQLVTASFNVLTDSGGNQVGGFYPGAMADAASLSFMNWIDQDALFCISAHDPAAMRRQVEQSKQNGLRLMYDPGQQVSNVPGEDLKAGAEAAEILIVNEYELSLLIKKTGLSEQNLRRLAPILITTHGAKGSVISGKNYPEPISISVAQPAKITDPTGAGDAYRAGFIYGYLRQWEAVKCGQLGAVLASFVLEAHGTQANITLPEIVERYHKTYKQEIKL